MKFLFYYIILAVFLPNILSAKSNNAAIIEPRSLAHNDKIKTYVYKPDFIYKYVGTYEYQSHIQFQPGENIKTISMGNTSGWEMIPSGNRLFLRPINSKAKTNMTLITDKRLYQFLLEAKSVKSFDDPAVLFEARFLYDDDEGKNNGFTIIKQDDSDEIDMSDPSKYNFDYTFSGPDKIAPVKVFDDGEFTYFEFRAKNAEVPAIFNVDSDGYEGLVNYRVKGNYIIVERVSKLYTLRHGTDTVCVFNEILRQEK